MHELEVAKHENLKRVAFGVVESALKLLKWRRGLDRTRAGLVENDSKAEGQGKVDDIKSQAMKDTSAKISADPDPASKTVAEENKPSADSMTQNDPITIDSHTISNLSEHRATLLRVIDKLVGDDGTGNAPHGTTDEPDVPLNKATVPGILTEHLESLKEALAKANERERSAGAGAELKSGSEAGHKLDEVNNIADRLVVHKLLVAATSNTWGCDMTVHSSAIAELEAEVNRVLHRGVNGNFFDKVEKELGKGGFRSLVESILSSFDNGVAEREDLLAQDPSIPPIPELTANNLPSILVADLADMKLRKAALANPDAADKDFASVFTRDHSDPYGGKTTHDCPLHERLAMHKMHIIGAEDFGCDMAEHRRAFKAFEESLEGMDMGKGGDA